MSGVGSGGCDGGDACEGCEGCDDGEGCEGCEAGGSCDGCEGGGTGSLARDRDSAGLALNLFPLPCGLGELNREVLDCTE